METLARASEISADAVDTVPAIPLGTRWTATRGRPAVQIQPEDLAALSVGRTTHQQIADLYCCSARTIRRRLVEFGLTPPGPPVYTENVLPDGTVQREYRPGTSSDLSQISDLELDEIIGAIC